MLDQDEINALLEQTDEIEDLAKEASEGIEEVVEPKIDKSSKNSCELGSEDWAKQKIDRSELPYPVEPEHKVVDQLSKVTADGEEKAGEIFDSISNATEKLNEIDQKLISLSKQCMAMNKFIVALQSKFPNVDIFGKKSQDIQLMLMDIEQIQSSSVDATNELYKAMETMQYQDISRQKIERVISVVKKLSEYLNNVFEDDSNKPEIKIAKHIHGDESNGNILADEEDIDNLIKEFGIEE